VGRVVQFADQVGSVAVGQPEVEDRDVDVAEHVARFGQ
jgi:hypothetical protein